MSLFKRREGVLSKDLHSVGGSSLYKGERVIYYRSREVNKYLPKREKRYEWCYEGVEKRILIRTKSRTIEGKEILYEK